MCLIIFVYKNCIFFVNQASQPINMLQILFLVLFLPTDLQLTYNCSCVTLQSQSSVCVYWRLLAEFFFFLIFL